MAEYNFKFKQINFWKKRHFEFQECPTEFIFEFQTNESVQCSNHKVCSCIWNKPIFSVTAAELDFVFYNKNVTGILKNIKNQLI